MILGIWMLSIGLAAAIAGERGRLWLGVVLGFTLGPLGVLVAAVIPPRCDKGRGSASCAHEDTRSEGM